MMLVSDKVYKQRIDTCENCQHYSNNFCAECGCYMLGQARIAAAACPLLYWPAEQITNENHS